MTATNVARKSIILLVCILLVFASSVLAQVDYCEGNFDNDLDEDGTDAFVFKSDFGRSSLLNPCPVIECQTAEQLGIEIEQLKTQVAQLTALLANVTRNGNDITFSGVNVNIVNGSGTTEGALNGLGNLIVGYNELRGGRENNDRYGSHNIVVGAYHNYLSYGGLIAGHYNTISAAFASVSGGHINTASGLWASVSGGSANIASGSYASVSGGDSNNATIDGASVSGGMFNTANTWNASVSGGHNNTASGYHASVSGGAENGALGDSSSVSGGWLNTANNTTASVSGGDMNKPRSTSLTPAISIHLIALASNAC